MIKLEQTQALVQARAFVTIESGSNAASIHVRAEAGARARDARGEWVERPDLAKQKVTFITDAGPVEMAGTVPEADAVDAGAVYRAVLQVDLTRSLTTAYEKGDRSREMVAVSLARVVEVWANPEKVLWRAKDRQPEAPNGKTVNLAGDKVSLPR